MYILNDLWSGNIMPGERYMRSNSEYKQISHKFSEELELFMKDLSSEKRKHYEILENLQLQLIEISEEDTFIVGFRMGARMMLDVISDYKGQFKNPSDE